MGSYVEVTGVQLISSTHNDYSFVENSLPARAKVAAQHDFVASLGHNIAGPTQSWWSRIETRYIV